MALAGLTLLLAAVLTFAVTRPRGLPEFVAAVPAAVLVLVLGALSWQEAGAEVRSLAPTLGFLAAILLLGFLADREGVFGWAGAWCARASRGRPERLLQVVFGLAAVSTAVLSLDATVVLLTPVVFLTASRLQLPSRPHVYACGHLANSASLLLPVSNLTNLLAVGATGLSFGRFAAVMSLPWLATVLVEYLVFRRFFRSDLSGSSSAEVATPRPPWYALAVLAVTLIGFLLVEPVIAAAAGVVLLAVPSVLSRRSRFADLLVAANVPFVVFVVALDLVVTALQRNGLQDVVASVLPGGRSFLALVALAGVAALLANLVNNIPAILLLLPPVAAAAGPVGVLAALIGVNLGPNLTYVGSLATLLWRRLLHERDEPPAVGDFVRLGAATVPLGLLVAVGALWLSWTWIGG